MDGWSSHGKGHPEGQEGAERAMGWECHPQVSMEDGKRKPLMEVGSLGVAPAGNRTAIAMTGLEQACHACLAEQG